MLGGTYSSPVWIENMNHRWEPKKVSVIGLGYVGLPTASILANRGIDVLGVDLNQVAVSKINRGQIHIHEPDLDVMVHAAVASGRLRASTQAEPADVFVIAVPTPFKDDYQPDLSYVEAAAEQVAHYLRPGNLIILESTSPVGTTEKLAKRFSQATHDVHIAYCPERVLPGQILKELIENDRIIGGLRPCCSERAALFYGKFTQGEHLITDSRTAEMAKLAENAFRDVNIAFANELSVLCDQLKVNVHELIRLANHHPRVKILKPGPGVGGHCIAIDPWFLWSSAPHLAPLIAVARQTNDNKTNYVVKQILEKVSQISNPIIACFGLTYKADVDDVRESPSIRIIQQLAENENVRILAIDPYIKELPNQLQKLPHVDLVRADTALHEANIIVGLVGHREFLNVDENLLANKIIIDPCEIWRKN